MESLVLEKAKQVISEEVGVFPKMFRLTTSNRRQEGFSKRERLKRIASANQASHKSQVIDSDNDASQAGGLV